MSRMCTCSNISYIVCDKSVYYLFKSIQASDWLTAMCEIVILNERRDNMRYDFFIYVMTSQRARKSRISRYAVPMTTTSISEGAGM